MAPLMFGILLVAACFKKGVLQRDIILSLSPDIVPENTTAILTCSKNSGTLVQTKWRNSMIPGEEAGCARSGNKCLRAGFLLNNDLYECSCNDDGTYSVHLKHVNRYQQGAIWSCRDLFSSISTVAINVFVSVEKVTLNGNNREKENSTMQFTCNASLSLPPPKILWYKTNNVDIIEITNSSFAVITLNESEKDGYLVNNTWKLKYTVNRSMNGWSIYCNASNWKNDQVKSNEIMLNVTYPPDGPPVIHDFINGSTYTVIETQLASLSCSVEGGNPLGIPTMYCMDTIRNISKEFRVVNRKATTNLSWNATRYQEKSCICQMDHPKKFVFVNIDVLYRASVKVFMVHGHENEHPVVANESNTLLFTCEMDSNPSSIVTINSPVGNVLGSSNKGIIRYNHTLLSCLDSGIYSCSGSNEYNHGQHASAVISLLVNCKPMAYSGIKKTIRSELNRPVALQFTAIAYPEPDFMWEIWTGSSWKQITEDSKFSITSSSMQSNLTVNNFTSSEITRFRIIVKNFIGTLIQNYTLKSFDRPYQPTELNHIPDLLTSTSVTLIWKPGFNGGTSQHFSIKYKGENKLEWETVLVQDTGEVFMYFTIRGLSSGTKYEFQIVAENSVGSSASSMLLIQTKESGTTTEQFDNMVGSVAGSITGVIVIVAGIVLGIFLYTKRYKRGTDRSNERASNDEVSEMRTITDEHGPYTNEAVYEEITPTEDRGSVERLEKSYEQLKLDKDAIGSIPPVYTNLTL